MALIPSAELDMTYIEYQLKRIFPLRPEIEKKILSSSELNEHLRWIYETFGEKSHVSYAQGDIANFPNITRNDNVRKHFNSIDSATATQLILQDTIPESKEILANHDISVGRMLRYFPAHWHANDYFEIYFSLSGSCPVYFKDEIITVKPGTVLVVAPSIVHATPCYADDNVLLYFLIRRSTFNQVFWNQLPADSLMATFFRQALGNQHATAYLHFETDGDEEVLLLLYRIYQEYCKSARYSAQMLNALMSTFFVLLLRRYEGSARLPRRSDFFWKHEFSAILTYIQSNFASVTIKSVAQHFHYSDRQIGRIVRNCTGLTFEKLLLKLRMEHAAKLLQQKNFSIETISAVVGYATSCSFYRAFGKYYGCTPREFLAHIDNQAIE